MRVVSIYFFLLDLKYKIWIPFAIWCENLFESTKGCRQLKSLQKSLKKYDFEYLLEGGARGGTFFKLSGNDKIRLQVLGNGLSQWIISHRITSHCQFLGRAIYLEVSLVSFFTRCIFSRTFYSQLGRWFWRWEKQKIRYPDEIPFILKLFLFCPGKTCFKCKKTTSRFVNSLGLKTVK